MEYAVQLTDESYEAGTGFVKVVSGVNSKEEAIEKAKEQYDHGRRGNKEDLKVIKVSSEFEIKQESWDFNPNEVYNKVVFKD